MLAKRIIPTILARGNSLVKGQYFKSDRVVGNALQASKIYGMRGVDELIISDITATQENRPPNYQLVKSLVDSCFMPITVTGGVKSIFEIKQLLRAGADKVGICTAAVENWRFIEEAASRFGSSTIVVSIDVKDGQVVTNCGRKKTNLKPDAWALAVDHLGAGEILLNSVDKDGTMQGYDLDLIKLVSDAVTIPVVAAGGCRDYEDMYDAIQAGAAGVAAGALFQFTEATPIKAAEYLHSRGIEVRRQ